MDAALEQFVSESLGGACVGDAIIGEGFGNGLPLDLTPMIPFSSYVINPSPD